MTRKWLICLVFVLMPLSVAGQMKQPSSDALEQYRATQLAELENQKINESSGLAVGRANPDLFWTHNDSGGKARLYAFDHEGKHRGQFDLIDVDAIDFEDMSSFSLDDKYYLVVGDIGDNERRRNYCTLYIVEEPQVDLQESPAWKDKRPVLAKLQYTYPSGPVDCESVAVDSARREILLVSKQWQKGKSLEDIIASRVYLLPLDLTRTNNEIIMAQPVATIHVPIVSAADISTDGRKLIVGTYLAAYEFMRNEDESWAAALTRPPRIIPMPGRKQGESICYSQDGNSIYLTSEKLPTPLWEVKQEADRP